MRKWNRLTNRGLLFDEMQKRSPRQVGGFHCKIGVNLKNLSYNLKKMTSLDL